MHKSAAQMLGRVFAFVLIDTERSPDMSTCVRQKLEMKCSFWGILLVLLLVAMLLIPTVINGLPGSASRNPQTLTEESSPSSAPSVAETVPFVTNAGPSGINHNPSFYGGIGGSTSLGGGPSLGGGSH